MSDSRRDHFKRLLPTLAWAETNLDKDLSLESLAQIAGLSPSHFHRVFREAVGETARSYVQRLRIERGAFLLQVADRTILDIALDVGFRNHETFTRAFSRQFGLTPSRYRIERADLTNRRPQFVNPRASHTQEHDNADAAGQLSATRVRRIQPMHVAFLRHVGDYEDVPASLFDDMVAWYRKWNPTGHCRLIGVGHDAPGITPTDQLRFDACVRVPEPMQPEGGVGFQTLPGGHYALTTHVGPFSTLTPAWSTVFSRVAAIKGFGPPGLPVLEMYDSIQINPDYQLNRTELCMPMLG